MDDLSTPVALFVYRRPEHTRQVLDRIRVAEPPELLVIGDGPADDTECEAVAAVRRAVDDADLECAVRTNYAETNLGLKRRFATGLEWVFDNIEEAIVLEDDTLPTPSFFEYCDELLDRFRGDERVWDIAGRNELGSYCPGDTSYFYSYYGGIWGWATWRSSYREYDPEMEAWSDPVVRDRIRDLITDPAQVRYVEEVFNDTHRGDIETWDYQWGFAKYRNNAVSVVPETNLVKNIGFGEGGTNTTDETHPLGGTPVTGLQFPIEHPNYVGVDRHYDRMYHKQRTGGGPLRRTVKRVRSLIE